MSFLSRATAVLACVLLTACGARDARFNPSHFSLVGPGAPPDVVLPRGTKPGSAIFGIVTLAPGDESFCCYASAHLDVPIRKDRVASTLRIGTFAHEGTVLRIEFPDGSKRTTAPLAAGFVVTVVPVPVQLRKALGTMRIRVEATQAPYTLTSIYFE